ncbi:hypothetical protein ABW21_db0205734 [Orbilia brochopaga]|nr:hypothetical protein ABW21_db0205734 [Drechslerella brochopaga]
MCDAPPLPQPLQPHEHPALLRLPWPSNLHAHSSLSPASPTSILPRKRAFDHVGHHHHADAGPDAASYDHFDFRTLTLPFDHVNHHHQDSPRPDTPSPPAAALSMPGTKRLRLHTAVSAASSPYTGASDAVSMSMSSHLSPAPTSYAATLLGLPSGPVGGARWSYPPSRSLTPLPTVAAHPGKEEEEEKI